MQSIAQDLGIKGIKSLDRDSLIYRILDGQAMQNSKSGAPAVVKEENRMNRREHRRNRIHSDAPSKVYTATGENAVKVEKNEPKKQNPESVKTPEKLRLIPVDVDDEDDADTDTDDEISADDDCADTDESDESEDTNNGKAD